MDANLRAGIAVYNAGGYHAAHDAWEEYWLDLESGTADERFLHGLIQFTAVVHHARDTNWAGAKGLANSALEYLDALESPYRGVALASVRTYLRRVADDPVHAERVAPPALLYDGEELTLPDLRHVNDLTAAAIAAEVLAETDATYDEDVLEAACRYAETDTEHADRFRALLFDFVVGDERRVVYERLQSHVDRQRQKESAVEDLFDPE